MAMNREVVVDPEELRKAATTLGGIASEMRTITERMEKMIGEIRDAWQDDNGKALADTYESDVQSQVEDYYNTVEAYSRYFKKANDLYNAVNARTASAINGKSFVNN